MKGYRRALWLAALLLAVSMAFYTGSTEADPTAIPTMTVPPEPVRLRSVRIRAAGDLMMHKKQLAIAKQKDGSYDFHPQYALIADSLYVGTLPVESTNIYASDAEVFGSKAFVYTLIVTATNDPVFRMPETGGSGFGYLPFAMLLCAAPLTFINKKSKRKGDQTA